MQLIYFRGIGECRASRWVCEPAALGRLDGKDRLSRRTYPNPQGARPCAAARPSEAKVQALVYVGDAMEEAVDDLCARAGELGLRGVRAFVFQEGDDPVAEQAFREIARLSRGAYCRFNAGAAHELRELLRAVAAYAAGGMKALDDLSARRNAGCNPAVGADEITMPTLFIGLLALALVLWLLKSFARADPRYLIKVGRTAGGIVALAGAAFMGARGAIGRGAAARRHRSRACWDGCRTARSAFGRRSQTECRPGLAGAFEFSRRRPSTTTPAR